MTEELAQFEIEFEKIDGLHASFLFPIIFNCHSQDYSYSLRRKGEQVVAILLQ